MLQFEPSLRITAADSMKHPYFAPPAASPTAAYGYAPQQRTAAHSVTYQHATASSQATPHAPSVPGGQQYYQPAVAQQMAAPQQIDPSTGMYVDPRVQYSMQYPTQMAAAAQQMPQQYSVPNAQAQQQQQYAAQGYQNMYSAPR